MSFAFPSRMDIACVRAGAWRIEGFDVERVKVDGKTWWQIHQRYTGQPERFIGQARTLEEICDLVDDELYRRHQGVDPEPGSTSATPTISNTNGA